MLHAGTYSQTADTTVCASCPSGTRSPTGSSSVTACVYPPPPPAYPSPPVPPGYSGSSPPPPLPPFSPAPPASPLPNSNPTSQATATSRANNSTIVSVPQSTTLTLSAAACANIQNFTYAFIASFQLVTMTAWNNANPNLAILQGDVYVPTTSVQAYCANTISGHRLMLQANAVQVASSIQTPPLTTVAAATAGATAYGPSGIRAYTSSQLTADYLVTGTTTFTLPVTSAIYSFAPPPSVPQGYYTSSASTSTNVGLVVGLSVGLFFAGAIIAGAAVFLVNRRASQSVEPK